MHNKEQKRIIEHASFMNQKELDAFYNNLSEKAELQKQSSSKILLSNQDKLINAHKQHEDEAIQQFHTAYSKLMIRKRSWDEKTCSACNGNLELVDSDYGEFWGCVNFRNKAIKHDSFNIQYEDHFKEDLKNTKVRIDSNWLTEIIKGLDLRGKIRASELLSFYDAIGLEDLRSKYGFSNTSESISGYVRAKLASRTEECEIENNLSLLFSELKSQLAIKYRLKGEKEKIAILDMVIADKKEVFIIEIKRNVHNIDCNQVKLYYELVDHILTKKNDKRSRYATFLIFNKLDYTPYLPPAPHVIWNSISNLANRDFILKELRQQAFQI